MKNYKEKIISLGCSDIASLTVRSCGNVGEINFGEDGNYKAYEITEDCEIPSHYEKVFEGENWLKIYDDFGLCYSANKGKTVTIYRAGSFGCIIQWKE